MTGRPTDRTPGSDPGNAGLNPASSAEARRQSAVLDRYAAEIAEGEEMSARIDAGEFDELLAPLRAGVTQKVELPRLLRSQLRP